MKSLGGLHLEPDWKYSLVNILKKLLFLCCHFPALDEQYIKKHIERPETEPRELEAYRSSRSNILYKRKALLVTIYLLYCLKNLYFIYETNNLFDMERAESNIKYCPLGVPQNDCTTLVGAGSPRPEAPGARLFTQVACMNSNCSRLAPPNVDNSLYRPLAGDTKRATLADDYHKLPIFHICHPQIDKIYTPIDKLDSFGVLAFACSTFNVFLLGVVINSQQVFFPSRNEMVFFLVAPLVTTRLAVRRSMELARDVMISYRNYQANRPTPSKLGPAPAKSSFFSGLFPELHNEINLGPVEASKRARERLLKSNSDPAPQRSDEAEERTATAAAEGASGSCEWIPIIRTQWWRATAAHAFLIASLNITIILTVVVCFLFVYIQYRVIKKGHLLELMAGEMRRRDCAIWLNESYVTPSLLYFERAKASAKSLSAAKPARLVDLAALDLKWSMYAMLETGLLNVAPSIAAIIGLAYYWCMVNEIMIWLAEARMFLVASLVMVRLKLVSHTGRIGLELVGAPASRRRGIVTQHVYNIPYLRRKFQRETYTLLGVSISRMRAPGRCPLGFKDTLFATLNSKVVDRMREQDLMRAIEDANRKLPQLSELELVQRDQDDIEKNIETLEKIYVNFRMFIEHIHNSAAVNATVFAIIYGLNYGLATIAVISGRQMRNLVSEPMFLIVFGLVIANALIIIGANFHANAKKLQPIIWSIIANMTHSNNMRVRHLRFLWLKQVQILDDQGGIALVALRLRVTYVNILQLAIWTATIMIIVMH